MQLIINNEQLIMIIYSIQKQSMQIIVPGIKKMTKPIHRV